MEEKEPDHIVGKPGIPEALDPTLGNGALWETNPGRINLKSVDPLKNLDDLLLDAAQKQMVLNQWNGIEDEIPSDNASIDSSPPITPNPEDKPEIAESKAKPVISRNKLRKTMEIEWAEDILPPETESENPSPPPQEEVIEPKEIAEEQKHVPLSKAGKRVRKVVKKAKEDAALTSKKAEPQADSTSGDSQLSSFTRWLKGLRGSEYVHPYEDDYALDQMAVTSRGGVSETFADLLATQGYKDKAIAMYMQLMEKYPEKSSFFAAKIEAFK